METQLAPGDAPLGDEGVAPLPRGHEVRDVDGGDGELAVGVEGGPGVADVGRLDPQPRPGDVRVVVDNLAGMEYFIENYGFVIHSNLS